MQITQNGVQIGPVLFSGFALVAILATLVGVSITGYRARTQGQNGTIALDLGTSMLLSALVLGRLFYILTPPPSAAPYYTREWYLAHPLDLLAGPVAVWNGGLGEAGVLAGALIGGFLVLRSHNVDLWHWADLLLPGVLGAAAILPWANIAAGQMLGPATSLAWGIPMAESLAPNLLYHPTPSYVSLWTLLVIIVLFLAQRRVGKGWPTGTWALVGACALLPGYFLADMLRVDVSRPVLGLSGMQTLSVLLEAGLVWLLACRIRPHTAASGDVTNFTEN